MSGCWESGGPDWLFPLALAAGIGGVAAILLDAVRTQGPHPPLTPRQRLLRALPGAVAMLLVLIPSPGPTLRFWALSAPFVVVALLVMRATRGNPRFERAPIFVGIALLVVAVALVGLMVALGGPCEEDGLAALVR